MINLEKDNWYHLGKWSEPALAAEVWLDYSLCAQYFFKEKLDGKIIYLNGDFFLSKHDADIYQNEAYGAAKEHNKIFFENIYNKVKEVSDRISKESHDKNTSIKDFLENYKELTGVWMPLNLIARGIEKYVEETDIQAFQKTKGYLNEKPLTLQQIDDMKEIKLEEEEIEKHLQKYEWLGSHHFAVKKLTKEELFERMKLEKDKDFNTEILNKDVSYSVWLLDLIGYARFRAAESSGYSTYYFKTRLEDFAKDRGVTYDDIVQHTIIEITEGNVSKEIADRRRKIMGFYFDGKEQELEEFEVKKFSEKLGLMEDTISTMDIKGLSACKGFVCGEVKIVINQEQMKEFKEGMILIAHETTPDIIFAMQKSAAIVTDFGGLTSHAAIVARELNKPCIVGTKIATKVFKDGDVVEVDAEKGIVRKIN